VGLRTDRETQEGDVSPALQKDNFGVPAIADVGIGFARRDPRQRDDAARHGVNEASPPFSWCESDSEFEVSSLRDSPSMVRNMRAWGPSSGFTQIADATAPVRLLMPCHTPLAGRLSRRLVVTSRLHSSKPSLDRASATSSVA